MHFREITIKDIPELFIIRTMTRENTLSIDELAQHNITQASIANALLADVKGWLCEIKGKIIGFAMGNKITGEMLVIALLPNYEKLGIGKQLLTLVENWLFSQGHNELWLTTSPDPKIRSNGFYKKLGWTATGIMQGNDEIFKKYKPLPSNLLIRPSTISDSLLIQELMMKYWGGEPLIIKGEKYFPSKLPGFLLVQTDEIKGFLFYTIYGTIYEIIVFEIFNKFTGLGTIMLNKFIDLVKSQQGTKIQVMTTNDNLDALRFYQRRGFTIQELRLNALKNSRNIKPTIPEFGDYKIPLRDEIFLALSIT